MSSSKASCDPIPESPCRDWHRTLVPDDHRPVVPSSLLDPRRLSLQHTIPIILISYDNDLMPIRDLCTIHRVSSGSGHASPYFAPAATMPGYGILPAAPAVPPAVLVQPLAYRAQRFIPGLMGFGAEQDTTLNMVSRLLIVSRKVVIRPGDMNVLSSRCAVPARRVACGAWYRPRQ